LAKSILLNTAHSNRPTRATLPKEVWRDFSSSVGIMYPQSSPGSLLTEVWILSLLVSSLCFLLLTKIMAMKITHRKSSSSISHSILG
jgi:hypothetical protein